ncbi:Guanylate cyclase 32E [Acromyrmex echinatior]|uniref:Guanylate cyclase n=1 Tax=Acromyrmex echinatior TaxID=103372 RepID=F4WKQ1_ACREC|nr:Guanylate cyclase 32E [Acromyrmex echinatior]
MYLFLMVIHVLLINKGVDAETFTLGYITGSKRRDNDLEYQRPGLRISGALTLAVEEVNAGELNRRGHKLDFFVAETYGNEEMSILMTADLWKKNVSAYIGPQETCIHEAKMAAAFNILMISYFCTHNETSNKKEFPTFARTRPPDSQIAKSVVSVLMAFNWTKVTFLYMNSTMFEFNKMSTVATTILMSFEAAGIAVNYCLSWNEPYHVTHMKNPFHELVRQTYRGTRIYLILGHYYEHIGLLMALDKMNLLEKGEYFVVGIDIEFYDEKHPNKYLKGLLQKNMDFSIIRAYRSYFSIVASAPINYMNFTRLVNKYRQKPPFNFTNPSANVGGIVQIVPETAYLYDAVHLYERSLLRALKNNINPWNGKEMLSTLRGIHYQSAMGYMVYMDENGDAEGNYTLIALDNRPVKGYGLYPIGYFIGKEQGTNLPMRDIRHDNLNSFIGACIEPPNICVIVEYCARGSLKDILENEDLHLDNMVISSLVGDIIRGMIYLHESVIKYHGSLSPSNCLVDSRWVVKLTDFGLNEFKRNEECDSNVIKTLHGLLYKAPELLRCTSPWELNVRDLQRGDVYSFAIVLYELQGRHGPFGITDLSADKILKRIENPYYEVSPFRPPLDQLDNTFDFIRKCLLECWSENPELRPDFKMIRYKLRPLRNGMKANIFDNMMAMMEKYANNLEALVDERTDQLTKEKKKTDALLYEILPRYVAEQLKMGHKVEAESFDCVTIYFSDIVGFTSMSAESTPLEIVDFLNDLYTCFDSTIENYDVYKVETIGDAYMVVSGLPIRNDIQHASEIASMSLCLLNAIKQFTIRHRPFDKLQLRIGIHSGPVCAGVVGLKMPRYCLFGDTVNTASRMESTGLPLKIQCSCETKQLLDQLGGFNLIERGVISMKGKGDRLTYWLIGEDPLLCSKRSKERASKQSGKKINVANALVPRSSLKNKSLVRTTFTRCSSDSPKRLRFTSSDQLNQKDSRVSQSESIADNSKTKISCVLQSSRMENWQSSSNSCPCVKKLYDQETQELINESSSTIKNVSLLRARLIHNNNSLICSEAKSFRFNSPDILLTCKSVPNSPKYSKGYLSIQKRVVKSYEKINERDVTPLIYDPGGSEI